MIRKFLYALLIVLIAGSVSFFILRKVRGTRDSSSSGQQEILAEAAKLLEEQRPLDAILVLMEHKNLAFNEASGARWLSLLATAYTLQEDRGRLTFLYDYFPALQIDEAKALLISQRYIELNRLNDFIGLRDKFRGKEHKPAAWLGLDAQYLLSLGRQGEAEQLLKSKQFQGPEEGYRLTQLALLEIKRNPRLAVDLLTKALELDSHNLQALLIRGMLFESAGLQEIARLDYTTALQQEPNNIFYADTLAEFFRRDNKISLSQQIWAACLNNASSSELWIKALFWNKVAIDQGNFWGNATPPKTAQEPLIQYLLALPSTKFWDWEEFQKLPFAKQYLQTEQSTFWLRILAAIQEGQPQATDQMNEPRVNSSQKQDQDILSIIQSSPFGPVAYDPLLLRALTIVATYRSTNTLPPEGLVNFQTLLTEEQERAIANALGQRHYIFAQLHEACRMQAHAVHPQTTSEQLNPLLDFLKSEKAYPALFLASGWLRSAVILTNYEEPFSKETPDWFIYGLAQCLRVQKSSQTALEWLQKQPTSPINDLLMGELALEVGAMSKGVNILLPLSGGENQQGENQQGENQIAYRASFLLATAYMERNELDKAQDFIEKNQALLSSVLGKELLARIALLKGNIDLAKRLYLSVITTSVEAKSFMAQDALTRGDPQKAIALTKQLLMKHPSNAILQLNYQRLQQLEQKPGEPQSSKQTPK